MADLSLEVQRVIHAPIERVFRAWTNADELKQWHSPAGMKLVKAHIDLQVDGSYSLAMQDLTTGVIHEPHGSYQEIDPPHKLVMSWGYGQNGPSTLVTVLLKSVDAGQTEVTIKHEHFTDEAMRTSHHDGWTSTLDRLDKFVT